MITYAIKHGDKYCAFGSYRTVRLVDDPSRASLYHSEKLVRTRMAKEFYVDGKLLSANLFKPVELVLKIESERNL